MQPTPFLILLSLLVATGLGGAAGWTVRGDRCEAEKAAMLAQAREAADQQRAAAVQKVREDAKITAASTDRVDVQQKDTEVRTQTVVKEVVRYVQNPAAGKCVLPPDWVRVYNASLGFDAAVRPVPETRPASDGSAGRVRADGGGR
ncbi:hypothetical protein ACK0NM_22290 [Pseudomonas aeruginosa]|uniref:hypothetical protein n=1 Tax=Pseudomonas aeruginosa TaxID=287 RepID=UPI0039080B76